MSMVSHEIDMYDKYLFAYTSLLSQLAANKNNTVLNESVNEFKRVYKMFGDSNIFSETNKDKIEYSLLEFKIANINLQIQISQFKYYDLIPICTEIHNLLEKMENTFILSS